MKAFDAFKDWYSNTFGVKPEVVSLLSVYNILLRYATGTGLVPLLQAANSKAEREEIFSVIVFVFGIDNVFKDDLNYNPLLWYSNEVEQGRTPVLADFMLFANNDANARKAFAVAKKFYDIQRRFEKDVV